MPETKCVTIAECRDKHKLLISAGLVLVTVLGTLLGASTWAGFTAAHKVEVNQAELTGWQDSVKRDLVEIRNDIKQLLKERP